MNILEIVNWIVASGPNFLTALLGVLMAMIVLFQLVPGHQPEAFLQKMVDFVAKFSRK